MGFPLRELTLPVPGFMVLIRDLPSMRLLPPVITEAHFEEKVLKLLKAFKRAF